MITPDLRRKYVENELKTIKWHNTIIWLLLCLFGTGVTIFLTILAPNGFLLAYPAFVLSTFFWFVLHDFFPRVDFFTFTDTLAFVITGLYFGIIFAMIFSKDRRQIFAAIALIGVYLLGWYWIFVSAMAGMT